MQFKRLLVVSGTIVLGLLVVGGIARRTWAQNAVEKRFDQLDRNQDGKVTPDEWPDAELFKRFDLDGNGEITKPEAARAVLLGALKNRSRATKSDSPESTGPNWSEVPVRQGPQPLRAGDHGVGRYLPETTFSDLTGRHHSLSDLTREKPVVLAMTSTSCPLSKKYLPTLVELTASLAEGITWVLVNPVATDQRSDMQSAADRFSGNVLYVSDPQGRLAQAVGALTTTDVIVLDRSRTIVYHGAIDDQYGLGYSLDAPRHRYLADALAAIRAGKQPAVAATEAPGCVLESPALTADRTTITYHNQISRLMQRHCIECHRAGGVAPFALDSYADVVAHAGMIGQVVQRGIMPPWFAAEPSIEADREEVHSPWVNDRSLAKREKQALLDWLAGGKPEGDPGDRPQPARFAEGWQIGQPDAIFELPTPVAIKATGTMPYQNVVVETHLPEERWVRAIEVQPGDRSVVHHVLVFVVGGNEGSRDEGEDGASERSGYWGIYVPGNSTLVYPEGFAKRLPQHARLRFQLHYTPNGTATTDQTRLGLIWSKEPPRHEVRVAGIVNPRISIPPGADNHREDASLRLPVNAEILGFLPHMHLRGKACRFEVTRSAGGTTTLLDIPRYDFNWQLLYRYLDPLPLRAGDTLRFTAWYDNSRENPANPDPEKTVRWGPQTYDEMQLGYVEYYVPGVPPGSSSSRFKRPRLTGGD